MPRKSIAERRAEYLTALEQHPEHNSREVCRMLEISPQKLTDMRKDRAFAAREVAVCENHPVGAATLTSTHVREIQVRMAKEAYLAALPNYKGIGRRKACRDAGITLAEYEAMKRADPAFEQAESEVLAEICEDLEEESVRTALGDGAKSRDSNHLRWLLSRLMRDKYGDTPKKIDVRHTGKLTLEAIDAEIAELERDEDVELLEAP